MSGRVVVKRVDASKESIEHCLLWMQTTVLPYDEPRAVTGDVWWIAYQDGNPVAFAALRVLPPGDDTSPCYLSRAGVLPNARGQGLQKKLIRARVQYAKKRGAPIVITDTADNPHSANSLIAEGFRMYNPSQRWALPNSNYWYKNL